MTTKILHVTAFLFVLLRCDQSFSQTLVNSTGSTIQNSHITIEYSIGEIGIATLSGNQDYLTQGLLQPTIELKGCNPLRFIPNAFTPNNDNLNDCFSVKNWPFVSSFELCIYNRWGQLVFKTNNILECWNGEFKRQPQPTGTYVYTIKTNTSTCGDIVNKGTVTIIR
jgi:gliding motility-associated-like protein